MKYDDLIEDGKEQWDAIEWDETGTVPTQIDPPAINKWLFNADTVDKVLEHLMTHWLKGCGWGSARQDDYLRQEPRPCAIHPRAI